jgi:uncharacterized protein YeaO (DUF488 family)
MTEGRDLKKVSASGATAHWAFHFPLPFASPAARDFLTAVWYRRLAPGTRHKSAPSAHYTLDHHTPAGIASNFAREYKYTVRCPKYARIKIVLCFTCFGKSYFERRRISFTRHRLVGLCAQVHSVVARSAPADQNQIRHIGCAGRGRGMIALKRAYEDAAPEDGVRFLVERLWPRGVKKTDLKIDGWLKEVAPSAELRRWFSHDPAKWEAFEQRYFQELDRHPEAADPIRKAARRGRVTLVYAAHDTEHNNAVALKQYLTKGKH